MRRRLATTFLLTIAALVAGTLAFVRSQAAADLLCGRLEALASERLGGEVTIGRCEVDPLSVQIRLDEVAARMKSPPVEATARRIDARLRSVQGLSTRLEIESLVVLDPVFRAELGQREPGPGGPRDCSPPELPVVLEAMKVEGARLELGLPGGRRVTAADVRLSTLDLEGRHHLELTVGEGAFAEGGRTEAVEALSAELDLDLAAAVAEVGTLSVSTGDLSLDVRGRLEGLCDPQLDATVVLSGGLGRLAELTSLPRARGPYTGRLAATARLSGPLLDPEVQGSVELVDGRAGRYLLGDMRVEARRKGSRLHVDRLTTAVIEGELSASGTIDLESGLPTKLQVKAAGGSLERLVAALGLPGAWVDGRLSVDGAVSGTLNPVRLAGPAKAELREFIVLERPVADGPATPDETYLALPPARIDADVVFTADALDVERARLRLPGTDLTAAARFPFSKRRPVRLTGELHEVDLEALGPVAGFPFAGKATGTVTYGGPYSSPDIAARVEARGFVFDGLEAGVVVGTVRYKDYRIWTEGAHGQRSRTRYDAERFVLQLRPKPVSMDIRISAPEARIEDVVAALENYHPYARRFVGATGQGQGTVTIVGPKKSMTVTVDATATGGVLFGQPYDRARVRGRLFERRRFELDEVVLTAGGDGRLTARGWAELDGPLAMSISAREIPVNALQAAAELPVQGRVSGDLVVEGAWSRPEASGALVLLEGAWSGVPLRTARVRVGLEGDRLTLGGQLSGAQVVGEAQVGLAGGRPFSLALQIDEPELERWLPLVAPEGASLEGWTGQLVGSLELSGRLAEPGALDGRFTASRLEARQGDFGIAAKGPVDLRLVAGGLAFERLVLAGPESELSISGVRSPAGALDLAVRGTAELALLERLVPAVAQAGGLLGVEATVTGTFEVPVLVGSARIRDGSLRLAQLPLSLTGLRGALAFSQNRVLFDDLTGEVGGGRVDLEGEVALRSFLPDRLRVGAALHEVRLQIPEDLKSTVSGTLVLHGPFDALALTGEVEILRARYTKETEIDQIVPSLRRRVFVPPNVEREPRLRLDVGLLAPGTFLVSNRSLRAALRADLRLVGTDARPGLLGTVNAVEGRARFRGNEYTVSRAVVDFKEPSRIAPVFDVRAEGDVRDYRVYVHAFGTPSDLRVTLESDPELPETDVVTLATLGITTRDAQGLGLDDSGWAAADALFAISGLDRQVREFIPENPIFRDPSVRLTSGYSAAAGQVAPRVAFESRLFTDDLRLRYSAPIGVPGQRTQAEYRITDVISAQAEWDTEGHRSTSIGNLGMDLKLRWEMD